SGNGYLLVDNGGVEAGEDVAEMPGGEIVVTGFSETHLASSINCWRFLQDGSIDNSFGTNGIVKVDSGAYFNFGWFLLANQDASFAVNGTGTSRILDSIYYTFEQVNDFTVLPDGRILCAGNSNYKLALYRLSPDGLLDTSYVQDGWLSPNDEWSDYREFIAARD